MIWPFFQSQFRQPTQNTSASNSRTNSPVPFHFFFAFIRCCFTCSTIVSNFAIKNLFMEECQPILKIHLRDNSLLSVALLHIFVWSLHGAAQESELQRE